MTRVRVTRDVPASENYSGRDVAEGEILFVYRGCTYGCISHEGVALSEDGDTPFFEFPANAVEVLS